MLDLLELETQAIVSCSMLVLGTDPGTFVRAASFIQHRAIFPAPVLFMFQALKRSVSSGQGSLKLIQMVYFLKSQ